MKALGLLSLVIALGIAAYLTMNQQTASTPDGSATAAKRTIDKARRVQAKAMLTTVESVLRAYKAENGSYPDDLEQLAEEEYIDRVPRGMGYDPATGRVWVLEE